MQGPAKKKQPGGSYNPNKTTDNRYVKHVGRFGRDYKLDRQFDRYMGYGR